MYLWSLFLCITALFPLFSEDMSWRGEPYALLLVQKAASCNRFEEKKAYLDRIALRLGLTLPQDAASRKNIDTTLSHIFSLFYPQENEAISPELIQTLQNFFGTSPSPLLSGEIDVIHELRKLDTSLSPDSHDNWDWNELQLESMRRDLLPLLSTLRSVEEKIEAINWYLFFLKHVRYPPLKEAFQRVDHYSSLGSIFSSQQGICLGTTILYAALCQKLDISFAIFTPPGHIFPAARLSDGFRVIETTARGSNVPLVHYETIDEPKLIPHSTTTILQSYVENKAADFLLKREFQKALDLYVLSEKIGRDGPHTKMIPLCSLLLGKQNEASRYAKEALQQEKCQDFLLSDIAEGLLSAKDALILFNAMSEENPFLQQNLLPPLLQAVEQSKTALSLRYHAALMLLQEHRVKDAKALLDAAPALPADSLHWLLLRVSIASFLGDYEEERRYAIELLKKALHHRLFSSDLMETCFSIYRKNPDCKELSSLLERALERTT